MKAPTPCYYLNPRLRLAEYADQKFAYDSQSRESPLVAIPTQAITNVEHVALHCLKGLCSVAQDRSEIVRGLSAAGCEEDLFDDFLRRNLLVSNVPQEVSRGRATSFNTPAPFTKNGEHSFGQKTFFGLPRNIDPAKSHVGVFGIPHASREVSWATEVAPSLFRHYSRRHCWFEVYDQGVYSEVSTASSPALLCQGVVLRDYGDLNLEDVSLPGTADQLKQLVKRELLEHRVHPLFIGGDHAITFPIVMAFLCVLPELGLIHLDAHNDLFYTREVVYSHAAPVSNLLRCSSIEQILSFGLRTYTDKRANIVRSILERADRRERIRSFPLMKLKQLLMNPQLLRRELKAVARRPYYMTIDLDILSEAAIGRQLSTPSGHGLEWHELLYFIRTAFQHLEIVGCDIVEYNVARGSSLDYYPFLLNSLLFLVVDGLAASNQKFASVR